MLREGCFILKMVALICILANLEAEEKNDFVSKCLPYDYQDINDDLKIKMEEIEQKTKDDSTNRRRLQLDHELVGL